MADRLSRNNIRYNHILAALFLAACHLFFAACARAYADPATLAATLKPEAVFANLSTLETVPAAAEQFAATLNIDPEVVRVRLKPGGCSLCALEARPEAASLAGLSVKEAEKAVAVDDEVSFFIPKFSCTFVYDGKQLTPQRCQQSPV